MVNRMEAGWVNPSEGRPTTQETPAKANTIPSPVASTVVFAAIRANHCGVETTSPRTVPPSFHTSATGV